MKRGIRFASQVSLLVTFCSLQKSMASRFLAALFVFAGLAAPASADGVNFCRNFDAIKNDDFNKQRSKFIAGFSVEQKSKLAFGYEFFAIQVDSRYKPIYFIFSSKDKKWLVVYRDRKALMSTSDVEPRLCIDLRLLFTGYEAGLQFFRKSVQITVSSKFESGQFSEIVQVNDKRN